MAKFEFQWTRGETLGEGAFGFVSVAKTHHHQSAGNNHHLIPPLIAVKTSLLSLSKTLWAEKGLLDKFKGCPSIIRCYGDDITTTDNGGDKFYNILLEYASGGCLADRIVPKKGIPESIVSRYTNSILTALVHIHNLGYVHCDVKPPNMLLFQGDNAKLADFGTCTSIDEGKCCGFRGTVLYAAPESVAWNKFVPESDVWGLGCSVLQMLTGKSPWPMCDKKDLLFKIGSSTQIPEIPKKISKEAKDFLSKCFVKDPTVRSKADTLLHHPFVVNHLMPHVGSTCKSSRLSIHSIVPHCFHLPKVHAT
ncbi:hypothetical protein CASFOL_018862 [Castilleja foliolosa]|uniref:Protein kinase domain-containing protein n=1 Tax=Castilleja foliolosa TaxID=1961234 RepID=A0ABD3D2T7_9LAMI